MPDHMHGPTSEGSVILDIGADIGALVINLSEALRGTEIEISAPNAPHHRTHVAVRERHTGEGSRIAAVFPRLRAGHYLIWHPHGPDVVGSASICGGQVTFVDLTAMEGATTPARG